MKQRLVILTLSLAALAIGLLGLSCTTNQNTNGNRGDNTNTGEATAKPPVTPPATPSGPVMSPRTLSRSPMVRVTPVGSPR